MIGYYLHHQGQGHRRRGTAIARELGVPVTGLGSGGPPEGWPGDWVELDRDDEPAVDPERAEVGAGGVLHWVPLHHPGLARRHHQVARWLAEARPSLVVVDVSVEIALLVRLCGVPVVVGGMPGDRTDAPHRLGYDVASAVLAPWPAGAHDAGGSGRAAAQTPACPVWEVGGISALAAPVVAEPQVDHDHDHDRDRDEGRPTVLVVWGSGGGAPDPRAVDAARESTGWDWTVRGGAEPAAGDLLAEMRAADVVVCHAGQGAVADVAVARRPAVVLPQPRPYGEQEATAGALERMRLAVTAPGWPEATAWPGLLDQALALGGQRWVEWGTDHGAAEAARRLREAATEIEERRCWPS